ncbi:MAG: amino acid permease [Deltaproteobacteria bacterium]|nr:amino acid permease [Deltaproteobacteria bacterium]
MAAKQLSRFDLLCLGVNAIIGSGIYLLPGVLAGLLGPASLLAFAICGVISLLIALCFAELAGRFDRSGGPYLYARKAFGPSWGYVVGWTCWSAAVISWAAVTRGMVSHLGHLVPLFKSPMVAQAVALSTIAGLAAINYRGVKPGALTTDGLTIAKLLPLAALLLAGLARLDPSRLTPFTPHGVSSLPKATFIAFFAYQGFEVVPVPAGESANARRDAPFAVITSILVATLLYLALQAAAIGTTPDLAGAQDPLARMAAVLFGSVGGNLVAIAATISMLGFSAGVALAGPRYLQPLADDGFLPSTLTKLHPRFKTPHVAIIVTAAASALLALLLDFSRLVNLSVLFVAMQYLSATLALPVLRKRQGPAQGFRVPGAAAVAPLATVAVLVVLWAGVSAEGSLRMAATFAGLILVGLVLWWGSRRLAG